MRETANRRAQRAENAYQRIDFAAWAGLARRPCESRARSARARGQGPMHKNGTSCPFDNGTRSWNCTSVSPQELYAIPIPTGAAKECWGRRSLIIDGCVPEIAPYQQATFGVITFFLVFHLFQGIAVLVYLGKASSAAFREGTGSQSWPPALVLPVYFTFLKIQCGACVLWILFWAACIYLDADPALKWNLASDNTGRSLLEPRGLQDWQAWVSLVTTIFVNAIPLSLETALLSFLTPEAAGRRVWAHAQRKAGAFGLIATVCVLASRFSAGYSTTLRNVESFANNSLSRLALLSAMSLVAVAEGRQRRQMSRSCRRCCDRWCCIRTRRDDALPLLSSADSAASSATTAVAVAGAAPAFAADSSSIGEGGAARRRQRGAGGAAAQPRSAGTAFALFLATFSCGALASAVALGCLVDPIALLHGAPSWDAYGERYERIIFPAQMGSFVPWCVYFILHFVVLYRVLVADSAYWARAGVSAAWALSEDRHEASLVDPLLSGVHFRGLACNAADEAARFPAPEIIDSSQVQLRKVIGRGGQAHVWRALLRVSPATDEDGDGDIGHGRDGSGSNSAAGGGDGGGDGGRISGDISVGRVRTGSGVDAVPVAYKKMTPITLTVETIEAACREAEILRAMRHPNIVRFFGIVVAPPHIALVTELLRGSLLCTHTRCGKAYCTSLPPQWRVLIAQDVANALAFLHENDVVMRDLKCCNVLLKDGGRDGAAGDQDDVLAARASKQRPFAKLCDFGIANVRHGDAYDEQGPQGTLCFLVSGMVGRRRRRRRRRRRVSGCRRFARTCNVHLVAA